MKVFGRIIKGIGGFYYVHDGKTVYECKARGIFRNISRKPLPGDIVEIETISDGCANITDICVRKSELIRPSCANAEKALLFFAVKDPEPDFLLIDKLTIYYKSRGLSVIPVFNKSDLAGAETFGSIEKMYRGTGFRPIFISVKNRVNIDLAKDMIKGGLTVISGPSGAGKSSFINLISPEADMMTGEISEKLGRGRHTTRHSQLFYVDNETYIMDTPGFTAFELPGIKPAELKDYYPEFELFESKCRFPDCVHIGERDCAVKDAVSDGELSSVRYENYRLLYNDTIKANKYV